MLCWFAMRQAPALAASLGHWRARGLSIASKRPPRSRHALQGANALCKQQLAARTPRLLRSTRVHAAAQGAVSVKDGPSAAAGYSSATSSSGDDDDTETIVLDVHGMKCGGCSAAVKRMLASQPYVVNAAVNLLTETAAIKVSPAAASSPNTALDLASEAAHLLTSKGFPSSPRSLDAPVVLSSDSDAAREAESKQNMFNLAVAWSLVVLCCSHHLGHLLHGLGYHQWAHGPFMQFMDQPVVAASLGAFALLGPGRGLVVDGFKSLAAGMPNMNSLVGLGSSTSYLVGAASFLGPSLGVFDLPFDPGFMEEPVMLLAFVLLGRALEARAKERAASDLKALARLVPQVSRLVLDPGLPPSSSNSRSSDANSSGSSGLPPGAELLEVATSSIRPGDLLRVLPGERFPCDGEVVGGTAAADESLVTGESRLVTKAPGCCVVGGTVLYEGPLTIRSTATGQQSTLAGIGRLVAEAQSREAPVQRLADSVAGKFCYGVMAASAATFAFWQVLGTNWWPWALEAVATDTSDGSPLMLSIKLAVDVLVVACPCALGLATPTAVLVGSSLGATHGLLLRGGDVLERVAGVDAVVFDKTGTLTTGQLSLQGVDLLTDTTSSSDVAAREAQEAAVLQAAAAVESATRHPLAAAVNAAAGTRGLTVPSVTNATTVPGFGVQGTLEDGQTILVGKFDWVVSQLSQQLGADSAAAAVAAAAVQQLEAAAAAAAHSSGNGSSSSTATRVLVARGGEVVGALRFSDQLRSDAVEVVQQLQARGHRVYLLSGDTPSAAAAVAAAAGIPPSHAVGGATPADKLAFIRGLQQQGMQVAMVGDGVNDAPALAAADVGVALRGGLDAAGEAASAVLMGDKLTQVLECISLGQATLSKIKQNLAWALVYNVVGIPLAAGALLPNWGIALNPSAAAGMMAFSSVAVVSNSLLLRAQYKRMVAWDSSSSSSSGGGGSGDGSTGARVQEAASLAQV